MARTAGLVISIVILLLAGCAAPRPGALPAAVPALKIAAVGDTHTYHWDGGEPGPVAAIMGVFSDRLSRADCREFAHQSTFLGPARPLARLPRAPITVASLANNHAMDCGPAGLRQTLGALHEHGIRTVGAGADLHAACEPLVLSVRGWTVAVLAYADLSPLILNYIGMEPEFPFAGQGRPRGPPATGRVASPR